MIKRIGLIAGPLAAAILMLLPTPDAIDAAAWHTLALLVLMTIWWVTEAIPIPVTGLVPLVFLPMAGIMPLSEAAPPYANSTILLLMGGFIIAKAVERWNLHTRIALNIVARSGSRPAGLVGGFMLASALLSMWISNTATTIMLTPIALSVCHSMLGDKFTQSRFPIALLLGIAYAASIGGLATPVGTPTNLIVIGFLEKSGMSISFTQWMMIGLPVVALMLPATWLILTKFSRSIKTETSAEGHEIILAAVKKLGKMSKAERRVLIGFACIAFLWIFRSPLNELTIMGTKPLANLNDAIIAIGGAIAMFLIPNGHKDEEQIGLLDWATAVKIPWGVLVLFGGGLSLAGAIKVTGLATWIGGGMAGLTALPVLLLIFILVTFVIFATELTSNVATISAILPIIGAMALAGGVDPMLLAAPAAMAASCAFMLPIATGPNAIVYASGAVTQSQMMTAGLKLNLTGIVLITLIVYFLTPILF